VIEKVLTILDFFSALTNHYSLFVNRYSTFNFSIVSFLPVLSKQKTTNI